MKNGRKILYVGTFSVYAKMEVERKSFYSIHKRLCESRINSLVMAYALFWLLRVRKSVIRLFEILLVARLMTTATIL